MRKSSRTPPAALQPFPEPERAEGSGDRVDFPQFFDNHLHDAAGGRVCFVAQAFAAHIDQCLEIHVHHKTGIQPLNPV